MPLFRRLVEAKASSRSPGGVLAPPAPPANADARTHTALAPDHTDPHGQRAACTGAASSACTVRACLPLRLRAACTASSSWTANAGSSSRAHRRGAGRSDRHRRQPAGHDVSGRVPRQAGPPARPASGPGESGRLRRLTVWKTSQVWPASQNMPADRPGQVEAGGALSLTWRWRGVSKLRANGPTPLGGGLPTVFPRCIVTTQASHTAS